MATKKKKTAKSTSKNWLKMIQSAGSFYFPVSDFKKSDTKRVDGPTIPPDHEWGKEPEWKNKLLFLYVFFEEKTKKYILPPTFLPFATTQEEITEEFAIAKAKEGARELFLHYIAKDKKGLGYSCKIIIDASREPYEKFFESFIE